MKFKKLSRFLVFYQLRPLIDFKVPKTNYIEVIVARQPSVLLVQ